MEPIHKFISIFNECRNLCIICPDCCVYSWIKANKNKNKGEAKEQKGEKEITSAGLL